MVAFANKKQLAAYMELNELLKGYSEELKNASLVEQFVLVEEIHQLVKEYAPLFYNDCAFCTYYKKVLDSLVACEQIYCAGSYPYDGDIFSFDNRNDLKNVDNLLDYIATKIRKILIEDYRIYIRKQYKIDNPYITIDKVDVTNMCKRVSKEVQEECKKLGIKCRRIRIDPGFDEKECLYQGSGYHFFNVITVRGREYLMDLTYGQFFVNNSTNMLSRLGIPVIAPCLPGIYMLMDEKRSQTAELILERGWVPFDEQNIKNYFDGFALSVRNGLYYEMMGGVDYQTPYTVSDYIHFIEGSDSMFKHEPREGLGRQYKPLKDPYMVFNRK